MDLSQSDCPEGPAGAEGTVIVYEIPIESFLHDYDGSSDKTSDEPQASAASVKPSTIRSRRCRARKKMLKAAAEAANPTVPKVAKTVAQRCKEYRERKKILIKSGEYCPSYLTNANVKSPAQRAREYRQRLRLKRRAELEKLCQTRQDIQLDRRTDTPKCYPPSKARNTRASTRLRQEEEGEKEDEVVRRASPYPSFAPALLEMDLNESSGSEPADAKPPASWLEPRAPSLLHDDSSCSTAFLPDENSSFFQFFRAIHGEYLELPARKRRRFRRSCLDFLHELLDDAAGPPAGPPAGALNLCSSAVSEDERDVKPALEDGYILPG